MTNVFSKRLVGAVGAVALTGGALGVVAPAQAVTASLTYTCTSLAFTGAKPFTMVADRGGSRTARRSPRPPPPRSPCPRT